MIAANKLLDKTREACSLSSDAALADRLALSRQQLSRWRQGHDAMPEDQIARIARIAHLDAGEWLLLIEAEQARGEARTAYGSLVKRLGIAALLALWSAPGMASTSHIQPGLLIMSVRKSLARFLAWFRFTNRSEHHGDLLPLQS